jgi:hypothetical protein
MKWFSKIIAILFLAALFIGAYLTVKNYRNIWDFVAFKTSSPGSVAEEYTKTLNLTGQGSMILYGTYPQVDEKIQFNSDCKPGKNVTEFGCYTSASNRIYVLSVNEPNLKTMTNVAIAHELLHAAYERMTVPDRAKINEMVEKQLAKTNDPDLTARLKVYEQTEPGNQDNELHSIFGSEYQNLSPELENYYAKYFNKRAMIAAWSVQDNNYIKGKEQTLNTQKAQIDTDENQLNSITAQMNAYKRSGNISSYNALVVPHNNLVSKIKSEISAFNQNVTSYNDMIASISSNSFSTYDLKSVGQ